MKPLHFNQSLLFILTMIGFSFTQDISEKNKLRNEISGNSEIPTNCDSLLTQARELSWEKQYSKSRGLYLSCLEQQANNADIYLGVAQTYFWSDSLNQALNWSQRGLKISPEYSELNTLDSQIKLELEAHSKSWSGKSRIGISLEQESSPFTHQALVDIQSFYTFNEVKYNYGMWNFSFSQLMVRYQENLLSRQVNQNSLWNHQTRSQAILNTDPHWKLGVHYSFDYWEDAWWTRFKMKNPSLNHLGGIWIQKKSQDHLFTGKFEQRTLLVKNFQAFKSELIRWDEFFAIHQLNSGDFSITERLTYSFTDDNFKLGSDFKMKYQDHQAYLGYSRFDNDQPQYNSWDHLFYSAYKYTYALESPLGPWKLSTRGQWNYMNEGAYNIRSSLDGLPRNSFFRSVYSIQPQIIWGQITQVKSSYFYNSDRYLAWNLEISQLF